MKIRNGFVSNSSSSSFLIYGVCFDESDFIKNVEVNLKNNPEILEKFKNEDNNQNSILDVWEKCELLLELFKSDFEFYIPSEFGYIYIGKPWDSIGDDETGSQFKEKIEQGLKKIFGNKIKVTTLEEAWMDG